MKSQATSQEQTRSLLYAFVYGSLLVLLACLLTTAFILSSTYLKKERKRAEISRDQLSHFFDFQYRALTEEMWTQNYEGINLRIGSIARQLGHATYDVVLANEKAQCVYSTEKAGTCKVPDLLSDVIPRFHSTPPEPIIEFDKISKRYVYMVPLYVGAVLKGYLYSAISDPYDFYRGGSVDLTLKMLAVPIACVALVWLLWLLLSQRFILKPYLSSIVAMGKRQAIGDLAAQVAHDIRSPLVVLKSVVGGLQSLEPTQRKLISTASGRIEGIADTLIAKFTGIPGSEPPVSFVSAVVDSLIAEKRVLLGEGSRIEIRGNIEDSLADAVVRISAVDLACMLSNIINNSIDALRDSEVGLINIVMMGNSDRILLSVSDNGKGIPDNILHQLKFIGGSYDKPGGAGLGLLHAKTTLGRSDGTLLIDSALGSGTTVTLEMPRATPPKWLAQRLDFSTSETIVVMDDDPSMHLLWKERIAHERVIFLTDPEQFDLSQFPLSSTRYIFDHDIDGSPVTGLDLIVSHRLGGRALLVTSHFNDPKIQKAIEEAGAKMLPKSMIPTIRINWMKADTSSPIHPSCDLVLIDDDPMLHELWNYEAKKKGLVIHAVRSAASFEFAELDRTVPIYVDLSLEGESGLDVAKDLYELGFKNISLATGKDVDRSRVPSFIREIRNKDFPAVIGRNA